MDSDTEKPDDNPETDPAANDPAGEIEYAGEDPQNNSAADAAEAAPHLLPPPLKHVTVLPAPHAAHPRSAAQRQPAEPEPAGPPKIIDPPQRTQQMPVIQRPAEQTEDNQPAPSSPPRLVGRKTATILKIVPKPVKPAVQMLIRHRISNRARQTSDDEEILLRKHTHWIFLVASAAVPALFTLAIIGVSLTLAIAFQDLRPMLGIFLAIIPAILTWFAYYEWLNDEYIVTNKRIIDVRRQLVNLDRRTEVNVEMIQELRLSMEGLAQRFFNYGNLIIDTASPGLSITFTRISNPRQVKDEIWQAMIPLRQAAQRKREEEHNRKIRAALLEEYTPMSMPHSEHEVAVWRRAITTLFIDALKPALILILALLLYGLALKFVSDYWLTETVALIVVSIILLGWFVWLYIDWVNDEYILTDSRIVDIQRIPLLEERRIETPLSRIQDVRSEVEGFLEILLNHGNVIIATASGQIVFHHVEDPVGIVHTINEQIKQLRKREEEKKFRDHIATARAAYQAIMEDTRRINAQLAELQTQQYRAQLQLPPSPQAPAYSLLPPPARPPAGTPPSGQSHIPLMSDESMDDDAEDGGIGPLSSL